MNETKKMKNKLIAALALTLACTQAHAWSVNPLNWFTDDEEVQQEERELTPEERYENCLENINSLAGTTFPEETYNPESNVPVWRGRTINDSYEYIKKEVRKIENYHIERSKSGGFSPETSLYLERIGDPYDELDKIIEKNYGSPISDEVQPVSDQQLEDLKAKLLHARFESCIKSTHSKNECDRMIYDFASNYIGLNVLQAKLERIINEERSAKVSYRRCKPLYKKIRKLRKTQMDQQAERAFEADPF